MGYIRDLHGRDPLVSILSTVCRLVNDISDEDDVIVPGGLPDGVSDVTAG